MILNKLLNPFMKGNIVLLKVGFFSVLATSCKLLLSLVSLKISAVYLGVSQFSLIYQFINAFAIFTLINVLALDTGIIVLSSKNSGNIYKLLNIKLIVLVFTTITSIILAIVLFLFSNLWSIYFLNTDKYSIFFKFLSFISIIASFNKIALAFLNGDMNFKIYYSIDIVQSLSILLIFVVLTPLFGINGAICSYLISPVIVFIFIMYKLQLNKIKQLLNLLIKRFKQIKYISDLRVYKPFGLILLSFATYTLISGILNPYTEILIRKMITSTSSIKSTSIWEALNRFNGIFTVFTSAIITTYAIPQFAGLKNNDFNKQLIITSRFIFIPVILLSLFIYFFRSYIILLLFSEEFVVLSDLVPIQLIGNVVSTINLLLVSIMLSKVNPIFMIFYNIFLTGTYFFLTKYFLSRFGINGFPFAYTVNSILGVLFLLIFYKTKKSFIC